MVICMVRAAARSDEATDLELRENAILAELPVGELDALRPRLQLMDVEPRKSVYDPGKRISHVYFPTSAVFSLVAMAGSGASVEVATTGREGMVGLPIFLGAMTSPHSAFCQVSGRAARLPANDLLAVLGRNPSLHQVLNRFTQAMMVQIAQNVLCNNTHTTEQRLCRWLLTTEDRVARPTFQITQEFMAQMLGVRRPTVSDTAGRLQDRGLIRYSRGVMTIVDRAKMEIATCDCYRIVKGEFDQIMRRK